MRAAPPRRAPAPAWVAVLAVAACSGHRPGGTPAASRERARIVETGAVDCFPAGTLLPDGKLASCELSGAAIAAGHLWLANDYPTPIEGRSSLFGVPLVGGRPDGQGPRRELPLEPFLSARKWEDMTVSPDGGWLLATTGFDRLEADRPDTAAFNLLVAWRPEAPQWATVLGARRERGILASLELREALRRALAGPGEPDGPAYFKVEGLAAVPGDRLLLGVGEVGRHWREFSPVAILVEVPWAVEQGVARLAGPPRVVLRRDGRELGRTVGVDASLRLASLTWDAGRGRLWLLTTLEREEAGGPLLDGWLWSMPLPRPGAAAEPVAVRDRSGAPLRFGHKTEAVVVRDARTLLVVDDDDRREWPASATMPARARHQALWHLVEIETSGESPD